MGDSRLILSVIMLIIMLSLISQAQNPKELKDSLQVYKPKRAANHYVINYASLGEISFRTKMPRKYPFPGGLELSDSINYTGPSFGSGYLGINTIRTQTFLLSGDIDCHNPALDWSIALFSEGMMDKTITSEKQEDGSRSIQTEKVITLFWDKGAGGMIVEKADTIGRFYIEMNPLKNEYLQQFTSIVYSEKELPVKTLSGNDLHLINDSRPIPEFGIYGKIRNMNFALLNNVNYYQSYIFIDTKLSCFFQSDIDFQPMLKKKDRIQPYLLFDNSTPVTLQNDLFRLAILSRLLMVVLGTSTY